MQCGVERGKRTGPAQRPGDLDRRPRRCRHQSTGRHTLQRGADALMHHQTDRGTHADAGVEDVHRAGSLGAKAVKVGRGVQARDDRAAHQDVQGRQFGQSVGRPQRVDAVPHADDRPRPQLSRQSLARHDCTQRSGSGDSSVRRENLVDEHAIMLASQRAYAHCVTAAPGDNPPTRRKCPRHAGRAGTFASARAENS